LEKKRLIAGPKHALCFNGDLHWVLTADPAVFADIGSAGGRRIICLAAMLRLNWARSKTMKLVAACGLPGQRGPIILVSLSNQIHASYLARPLSVARAWRGSLAARPATHGSVVAGQRIAINWRRKAFTCWLAMRA